MTHAIARLPLWLVQLRAARLVPILGLLALAGCGSSANTTEEHVKEMEPQAEAAAQERAATDLACGAISTQILEREHGDLSGAYGLKRVVYLIQATGCGMRARYSVACSVKSVCSALSDGGVIERVKQ
jgi:hypothetical protein